MGRAWCRRTHRYTAWNRRSQPDLLRDNKGAWFTSIFSRAFDRRQCNEYEGAYTLPQSVGIAGGCPFDIILRWFPGRQSFSTWTLIIHARLSPCDRPRRRSRLQNVSVSVGSRLGKPSLKGDQYHLHFPAIMVLQRRPRPAALAHRRSHTRPPHHHHYQNNCPQAALPPEVHTCVRTQRARIAAVAGPCCRTKLLAMLALDATHVHYVTSYSASELRTFHC